MKYHEMISPNQPPPRCGYKRLLEKHMLRHKEPQFKCSFCGKMIKTKTQLAAHERLHTGETPFQCAVCGKSFAVNAALTQHKRLVHKITGPLAKPNRRELERGVTEFSVDESMLFSNQVRWGLDSPAKSS